MMKFLNRSVLLLIIACVVVESRPDRAGRSANSLPLSDFKSCGYNVRSEFSSAQHLCLNVS